jgi:hypothetical protein
MLEISLASLALLALLALGGLGFVYRRWQRAETALREARWRLQEETTEALRFRADLEALAQGGTEALLLLDQERRIRWANRPAMERLGARPGRTLLEATQSPELGALIPPPAPSEGEGDQHPGAALAGALVAGDSLGMAGWLWAGPAGYHPAARGRAGASGAHRQRGP